MTRYNFALFLVLIAAGAIFLLSCGGGPGGSSQMATVTTSVSDPAPCGPPQGQFAHVYVTITDVQINASASAGDNDASWIDLTPNLSKNPVQVDLLGIANQCFLATLGSTGIKPGTYQQLRIMLADNSAVPSPNNCGATANCVVLSSSLLTPMPLQLSSETKTGIKIPSGQLAGGQFVVAAGDNKDLNIDFNTCASIVMQGNGQFRLKPVLHAGEVDLQSTSTSISGTVIDHSTGMQVSGTVVVALEKIENGVDRVIMATVPAANGTFSFCPVSAGTYDIVVSAFNSSNIYAATVVSGVQPGNTLGNVPVFPVGVPATITANVTTTTGTAAASADIELSALQPTSENSMNVLITTPLAQRSAATLSEATIPNPTTCPTNTDCLTDSFAVPAANPTVVSFTQGQAIKPATPTTTGVNYTLDATASVPQSGGASDCNPSEMRTAKTAGGGTLTALPNTALTAHTLAFTMCQPTP